MGLARRFSDDRVLRVNDLRRRYDGDTRARTCLDTNKRVRCGELVDLRANAEFNVPPTNRQRNRDVRANAISAR